MKPSSAPPSQSESCPAARLGLQAACIFAASVVLGLVYNSASPLGIRPRTVEATAAADVPTEGYHNETLSLTLEIPPASRVPGAATPVPQAAGTPVTAIPTLTWPQVRTLIEAKKVVVVDARAKPAFDLGHIPGAVLLPSTASVQEVQAFAAKYPKDTALVVYCASTTCRTSRLLAQQLMTLGGFTNVSEMPGGFAEYTMAQASGGKP